jgi:hypothetical protein
LAGEFSLVRVWSRFVAGGLRVSFEPSVFRDGLGAVAGLLDRQSECLEWGARFNAGFVTGEVNRDLTDSRETQAAQWRPSIASSRD